MSLPPNRYHSGIYEEINVRMCMNYGTNLLHQFQIRRFKDCLDWNAQTGVCTECAEGTYLTRGLCCQLGYEGVTQDGV